VQHVASDTKDSCATFNAAPTEVEPNCAQAYQAQRMKQRNPSFADSVALADNSNVSTTYQPKGKRSHRNAFVDTVRATTSQAMGSDPSQFTPSVCNGDVAGVVADPSSRRPCAPRRSVQPRRSPRPLAAAETARACELIQCAPHTLADNAMQAQRRQLINLILESYVTLSMSAARVLVWRDNRDCPIFYDLGNREASAARWVFFRSRTEMSSSHFGQNVWKYKLMNTASARFNTTVRQLTGMSQRKQNRLHVAFQSGGKQCKGTLQT